MDLRAVEKRSLADAVFDQLRARILDGAFPAGSQLPSERKLCEQLGVNRGALREALQRLQQLRLVVIRQGEATRVLDFRRTAGLDLLAAMLFQEGSLSLPVARSLIELRAALGPDIARLAAQRRSDEAAERIRGEAEALATGLDGTPVALEAASFELWRLLVEASENIAYQLAFNTLERVWSQISSVLAPTLMPELTDAAGYRTLAAAVVDGDAEAARVAADRLVRKGSDAVLALVEAWLEDGTAITLGDAP